MEEKSLINKENESLFKKIKNFLRGLFNKKEEDTNAKESFGVKQDTSISLIDEFKDKQIIEKLQQDYENGKIAEEDIDEKNKQKLLELYKEQIKTLNDNINVYKNSLKSYKERIITIRKTDN